MYTPSIDNPFIKYNSVGYLSTDGTSSVVTTPEVIDFSATTPVETSEVVSKPDAVKPIPLVDKKNLGNNNTGLAVETTSKPTLDQQTMRWFKLSQAQWDALTDEEKQIKTQIAFKGMVDAHNKHQEEIGSKKRLSYAGQLKLFTDRTADGDLDQVDRVTGSVKSLHGKDQADAVKVVYQFKHEGNRNRAEKNIANDYVDYDPENVLLAAKETKKFLTDNQAIAAGNAWHADNSLHKDLVSEYMTRDNEKVQTALADNIGNFGKDENGNITEEGKEIQYDCYKKIIGSKYDSVVTTAAENIWTMDKSNQAPAVNDIYATNNSDAKNAVAENYKMYDESARSEIKLIIYNSDYDSAKNILQNNITSDNSTTNDSSYATATVTENEESAIEKFNELVNSGATPKLEELKDILKNATDVEKSAILKNSSGNKAVIMALLASNPSQSLLDEIIDYMNENKLADKDQNELVGVIVKSRMLKGSKKLGTTPPEFQKAYLAQLEPSELKDVNRNDLSAVAKDFYDKRLAEFEAKEQSVKKFGLFIG